MNCTSCGAAMRLEADKDCWTCDFCRNIFIPEPEDGGVRVLDEPAVEPCPVCAISMVHAAIDSVRILYCKRCRGMLIPVEVFAGLVVDLRARREGPAGIVRPPDWKALDRHIPCPRCRQPMGTHFYGGPGNIILDNCPQCELNWLDHGELQRLIRAPGPE